MYTLDLVCQCDTCRLAFQVKGDVSHILYQELGKLMCCPRCPGRLYWLESYQGPAREVDPEQFYGIVMKTESLGDRVLPETVAALLCTYRIIRVEMQGPGVRALELEGGIVLELGISAWGAYVTRIIKKVM